MTDALSTGGYTVAALYKFARFADPAALRQPLLDLCTERNICGSLLLAGEGINGTVAGSDEGIAELVAFIRTLPGCSDLEVKYSHAAEKPFGRMKVKLKREIVTMGICDIDPAIHAGTYVEPEHWNALISDPDVLLIDTRNDYEVAIGTFEGAVNPEIGTFRAFPEWFTAEMETRKPRRVAMFCTGGIRCEKSTAFARAQGFDEVYHLKGGILRYLEQVPADKSMWNGQCYVFDERISVGHGLVQGNMTACKACGAPYPNDSAHNCPKGVAA